VLAPHLLPTCAPSLTHLLTTYLSTCTQVVVSHDEALLEDVCDHIAEVSECESEGLSGRIPSLPCGYQSPVGQVSQCRGPSNSLYYHLLCV
jgi:hypothetical protein